MLFLNPCFCALNTELSKVLNTELSKVLNTELSSHTRYIIWRLK
jgi:hypothetical protein